MTESGTQSTGTQSKGPLAGVTVVEMAAIGPVPFCGMVLADMGATVVRIDRVMPAGLGVPVEPEFNCMARGKKSIAVDLKQPAGLAIVKQLVSKADALIEGFRPDVMERIGLGPEVCFGLNPKLVFGRCSGWGDEGPLAARAAHDINYIGLSGYLAAIGCDGPPPPPLNYVGDFGGAAMHLVAGILAALLSARTTGQGQVVSTNIALGAVSLMPMTYGLYAAGRWSLARASNPLDGGAPFYRCYETSDGRYMAVGAIEAKFYGELLNKLGLDGKVDPARQHDRATWEQTAETFAGCFRMRSRAAWTEWFKDSDACVTPVLDMSEAPEHPQQIAAEAFVTVGGIVQPASGVRFGRAVAGLPTPPPLPGADTATILDRLGYDPEKQKQLRDGKVVLAEADSAPY